VPQPNQKTNMSLIVFWRLWVSRIDAEALADCSIALVRLQRSYDRLVSSSCVAPRTSEHWQNVVVCRCSLHWPNLQAAPVLQVRVRVDAEPFQTNSRAAAERYNSSAVAGDRYRPLSSSHWSSLHFGPQPAWLLQQCAGWATCQLDPASSVGSKRCSMSDFRLSPFWTHNGRARQSSLASCPWAHPLQSRRAHLPSSEWQCSGVTVILLHLSRWRAISVI